MRKSRTNSPPKPAREPCRRLPPAHPQTHGLAAHGFFSRATLRRRAMARSVCASNHGRFESPSVRRGTDACDRWRLRRGTRRLGPWLGAAAVARVFPRLWIQTRIEGRTLENQPPFSASGKMGPFAESATPLHCGFEERRHRRRWARCSAWVGTAWKYTAAFMSFSAWRSVLWGKDRRVESGGRVPASKVPNVAESYGDNALRG